MSSAIELPSSEPNTTYGLELGIIEVPSTVQVQNLSFVDEVLIAALYGDDPLIAVPWLQLTSSLAQATSLLILVTVLLRERRRAKGRAHKDAWVQLDQAATPSRSDAVLRAFLLVSTVAFAFSAIVLLLLCSPIVHTGIFAGAVYVGQGVVDMLPLLWSLQAEPAFGAPMALRAALVLGTVAITRVFAVAGRPPLMAFTPGASSLYVFAPSEYAMHLLPCTPAAFVLLYGASRARNACTRAPPAYACRREARGWLAFVSLTYVANAVGVVVLVPLGVSDEVVLCIQWSSLLVYSILFAPALYHTYLKEARYCRVAPLQRRLMNAEWGPLGAGRDGGGGGGGGGTGGGGGGGGPRLLAPPGALPGGRKALEAALRGVHLVGEEELLLHELVGAGGFAEVFRATWRPKAGGGSVRTVAVKQLRHLPHQPAPLRAFCSEISIMHGFAHPNVLGLLGVCAGADGSLRMVTDYVARGSLFHLLHRARGLGPPSTWLALRFLAQCARGMHYLHSRQPAVLHRDLKSQNLLVTADGSVQVADFGLSRESDGAEPAATTRVGSVQWAAPEVLLGHGYSHTCDVWSFGVVCWELSTARIPFDGMSLVLVARKVALEGMRLPVPADAPLPLLRLMARCWAEAPAQRPEFAEVLAELEVIRRDIPKGAAPWAWLRSGPPAEGETSLATPVEPADDVP